MSSSTNLNQAALDAVTVVGEGKFRITWKFEKFCATNKQQTSAILKLSTKKDSIRFYIFTTPSSFTDDFDKRQNFIRIVFDDIPKHLTLQCSMSLIDSTGDQGFQQECICWHNSTFRSFNISRDYLFDSNLGLLNDDTLTVYCEVNILNEQRMDVSLNYQQQAVTSKMLQDYESLLESAKFADVVLVVGKGRVKKELNAHKNILSARSPVFSAMFEHKDTKEAKENRVLITDVSPDVFEQFLRFVYTGKLTDLNKYASDLLIVADKYQMDCLKSRCSHYLSSELTTESVASVLVLADLHNVSELKSKCIDYIVEHASEVMASKDWKLIKDNSELVVELFQMSSQLVKKFKK